MDAYMPIIFNRALIGFVVFACVAVSCSTTSSDGYETFPVPTATITLNSFSATPVSEAPKPTSTLPFVISQSDVIGFWHFDYSLCSNGSPLRSETIEFHEDGTITGFLRIGTLSTGTWELDNNHIVIKAERTFRGSMIDRDHFIVKNSDDCYHGTKLE
jgi:hypothetical protein